MSTFSESTYDAKKYATIRPSYPQSLFVKLREYLNLSDNGRVSIGIDVGCGPGEATRSLAQEVAKKMFGLDPSEVMLAQAKERNSDLGDRIHWIVGDDTTLTAKTESHTVDLVTVAEAAHWLNYPDFWESTHQVLKKGGVLAYWGYYDFGFVGHPESYDIIREFGADEDMCGPYWAPGQHLLRDLYRDLLPPSNLFTNIQVFRDDSLVVSDETVSPFQLIQRDVTVGDALQLLSTYSAYHSWKSKNGNTKEDILQQTVQKLLKATGLTLESKVTVKTHTVLVLATAE